MNDAKAKPTTESPRDGEPKPPLRWDVSIWALVNSTLSALPVLLLGEPKLLVYSAAPALILTLVMILAPPHLTSRIGLITGAIVVLMAAVSAATAPYAPAVVIAMVLVVYISSLPTRPGAMVIGAMASLAYLVFAWLGTPVMESTGVGVSGIVIVSASAAAITIVAFLAAVWILARIRPSALEELEEIRDDVSELEPDETPSVPERAWRFLGPANPMFRYALVRSIAVGVVFALVFAERGERSAFWVLLAMLLVSRPTGRASLKAGLERTVATLIGVIVFLVALFLLQESVVLALSLGVLFVGLAFIQRSSLILTACATFFVIALSGAAQSDYLDWAYARVVDTVIGSAIGVVVSVLGEARPETPE
jgi:hypothetical protein